MAAVLSSCVFFFKPFGWCIDEPPKEYVCPLQGIYIKAMPH